MSRTISGDWHNGVIPDNVVMQPGCYVETSYSFHLYRSRRPRGVVLGEGCSAYIGCMFDMGEQGAFSAGRCTLLNGLWLICDSNVSIGDYGLISWNVVIMDNYRASRDAAARRAMLQRFAASRDPAALAPVDARPVSIGNNVWIGFDCCILPGTVIEDGAVIGARSVVSGHVPAYAVYAGNPARFVRCLVKEESRAD